MFIISKTSWHYHFAAKWDNNCAGRITNLCPYVRMVLKGLFAYIIMWTVAIAFVGVNLLGIADAVAGIWLRYNGPGIFAVINVGTLSIILMIVGMFAFESLEDYYRRYQYDKRHRHQNDAGYIPPQPGFIKLWWISVHDKVCPSIKIE